MKFKKIILSILIIISIISINSKCYARYVIEHVNLVAKIEIIN